MKASEKAVGLFKEGYNCAQAVFGAFSEITGISPEDSLKISSAFGGGIGRQREVCGAVSGMLMAFGTIYGYSDLNHSEAKAKLYEETRKLCGKFCDINGSMICREILKNAEVGGKPEVRTEQYYKERPCERCVRTAAEILEEYIKTHD